MFESVISLFISVISISAVFLYGTIGEILIEKAGHLNLGIPGIMCFGGIGGCTGASIALNAGMGTVGIWTITVFFAFLYAGAVGALYGLLTITLRCNQNSTGLILTTFGSGVLGLWGDQTSSAGITFHKESLYFTKAFFGDVGSDWFSRIFLSQSMLVYFGIFLALILALVLNKTKIGLNLRAVGENPGAADVAGLKVNLYKYLACIIGAGVAGIGGAFYLLVRTGGALEYVIERFGWLAVALVIFSLWRPSLSILGSIIFGFLYLLPNYIKGISFAQIELFNMIPYMATAIVLIIVSFLGKKETQPPASLGVPYFREER